MPERRLAHDELQQPMRSDGIVKAKQLELAPELAVAGGDRGEQSGRWQPGRCTRRQKDALRVDHAGGSAGDCGLPRGAGLSTKRRDRTGQRVHAPVPPDCVRAILKCVDRGLERLGAKRLPVA